MKITDFGAARAYKHICEALPLADGNLSLDVCSHWYAAVELLLEDRRYSEKVDVWSIGCIIGELVTGYPLFRGKEDKPHHVVRAMQRQLGRITASICPSARQLESHPKWDEFSKDSGFAIKTIAPNVPEWDRFIKKCIRYDPAERPSAQEALELVPTGPGTCAAIKESKAELPIVCALPPGGNKRRRLNGKKGTLADLSALICKLRAATSCSCSCNCRNPAHAPQLRRCTHAPTAGTLEKPLCMHCVCLVDGCNAPRNKSCCCLAHKKSSALDFELMKAMAPLFPRMLPMDVQSLFQQFREECPAAFSCTAVEVFLSLLKEPSAITCFMGFLRGERAAGCSGMLHMEWAFVSTLKRFGGGERDDAQKWEARNLSRQRGYHHMGLVTTAKKFNFVQDPSCLCPAARREAEIVVLGAEQQRLALCREPTAFRTFYQQLEAAEKDFPALASPMDLPAHMAVFNAKLKMALEKAIGLSSWKYLGPHLSRKHFLLMAERFGGCCQRNAPPLSPQSQTFEEGWKALWQKLTVGDLKRFCPDSGGHLDVFPAALSAESLSLSGSVRRQTR